MGGRPTAPYVHQFYKDHPHRSYTAAQAAQALGLESRQVLAAITNARREGAAWVDHIRDLDPDKRFGKRYRWAGPDEQSPAEESLNGIGAAEMVPAVAEAGSQTSPAEPMAITLVGHTKAGPVVRDQHGKLYTLREL